MYICLPAYMTVKMLISATQARREGTGCPGTGVTDGCELPCMHWDLNPDPLQEQPVVITAEPSVQLSMYIS